jgi:hypothetical protein
MSAGGGRPWLRRWGACSQTEDHWPSSPPLRSSNKVQIYKLVDEVLSGFATRGSLRAADRLEPGLVRRDCQRD